jgi:hypothetical protein
MDEAGTVGTDRCARIAEHVAAAEGKLIAAGDSRQLAEVEAGGAFRAISERFGAVTLAREPSAGRSGGDPGAGPAARASRRPMCWLSGSAAGVGRRLCTSALRPAGGLVGRDAAPSR